MQGQTVEGRAAGPLKVVRVLSARPDTAATLLRFMLVGGAAFFVHQGGLYALYDSPLSDVMPDRDTPVDLALFTHPDIRLLIASVLAVQTAIVFKFVLNERWTFKARPQQTWIGGRFLQFNVSALASAVIVVLTANVLTPVFAMSPYLATAIGVLAGFTFNWLWSTWLIWPSRRSRRPAASETGAV
jgi:putative flippase GtrA